MKVFALVAFEGLCSASALQVFIFLLRELFVAGGG